jgi:hypothetical protein
MRKNVLINPIENIPDSSESDLTDKEFEPSMIDDAEIEIFLNGSLNVADNLKKDEKKQKIKSINVD